MNSTVTPASVATAVPSSVGWKPHSLRYVLHVFAACSIFRFASDPVAFWIRDLASILHGSSPIPSANQFLMSNLLMLSTVPAFFLAFLANTKLRHRAACFVWIVPVSFLAYNFLFHSATIYPTIFLQSDFRPALHFWFGKGFNIDNRAGYMKDVWRVYDQFRYTAPAYAGLAYSLGAWVGLKLRISWLDRALARW